MNNKNGDSDAGAAIDVPKPCQHQCGLLSQVGQVSPKMWTKSCLHDRVYYNVLQSNRESSGMRSQRIKDFIMAIERELTRKPMEDESRSSDK